MARTVQVPQTPLASPEGAGSALAVMVGCVMAVCALAMALGAYWITRKPPVADLGPKALLGAMALDGRGPGRMDLRVSWPALLRDAGLPAPSSGRGEIVSIAVLPADDALPPADRPTMLYARFVSADARSGEGGLIRRRFRGGTPYEGEDLFVASPDGRGFWARCLQGTGGDGRLGSCLTEIRLGRMDLQVRFSPALLSRWESLSEALRRAFAGVGD